MPRYTIISLGVLGKEMESAVVKYICLAFLSALRGHVPGAEFLYLAVCQLVNIHRLNHCRVHLFSAKRTVFFFGVIRFATHPAGYPTPDRVLVFALRHEQGRDILYQ
jgi:hypothetical protein